MNAIVVALTLYNFEHVSFKKKSEYNMCACFVCVLLFSIQLCLFQLPFKPVSILFVCICAGSALFWPFLICHFATKTTDRVKKIGINAYGDYDWFKMPSKLQKYMILIILRAQDPPKFGGLQIVPCTIEVFGKVFYFHSFIEFEAFYCIYIL